MLRDRRVSRQGLEAVAALGPGSSRWPEQGAACVVTNASRVEPGLDPFDGLRVQRHAVPFAALSIEFQNLVDPARLVVADRVSATSSPTRQAE